MNSQPILVTGAAGFIGSHVVQALLERGETVVGLDNFDPYYDRRLKECNLDIPRRLPGFSFYELDLADRKSVSRIMDILHPAAIIHMAALAGVRPSLGNPQRYHRVNVIGTEHLMAESRAVGVRSWVLASSSSVYGPNAARPFIESEPHPQPISPYGATKLAMERNAHPYSRLEGRRIAALRFFTVYGPRQRPDLAIHKFAHLMSEGRPLEIYGDGSAQRDFTYIDDIVQGVLAALEWTQRDGEGVFEIFNLGESRTVTVNAMIDALEVALGLRAHRMPGPPAPGDMPHTHADIGKARRMLGYQPKVGFEDGIARFAEWFRGRSNP